MKYISILLILVAATFQCKSQKVFDPCQKLDTNTIKRLMTGTWVDMKDTSHTLVITEDSLTEKILIMEGGVKKVNTSYWSYKFTDNMFSSDAVTCYSLVEYKEGYAHKTEYSINAIDENYFLLGATGKNAYKRKK
ncbi:MAG TPA: hypothetical protein VK808_12870 [Bacteroidia bacterium]|jgi:hypothetical protein|nr:hypothetical protein [Bacteroidia bacterium]